MPARQQLRIDTDRGPRWPTYLPKRSHWSRDLEVDGSSYSLLRAKEEEDILLNCFNWLFCEKENHL